jgi:DNA-directed RNA polymerase specialized sigma24 family protein
MGLGDRYPSSLGAIAPQSLLRVVAAAQAGQPAQSASPGGRRISVEPSDSDSVSGWIRDLKAGDHAAAAELWKRYFGRLVGLARKMLQAVPKAVSDEEDVALSAFKSLCLGAERGQFDQLADRENLWSLLAVITARKAYKRKVAPHGRTGTVDDVAFEELLSREPTPADAALLAEEYRRLLDALGDDQLRAVAVWRMEGYTNPEIAAKLKLTVRSVERKLEMIRALLEQELSP